jgi:hypothetical protein
METYQQFQKPPLSPPAIVFPIVWTILFILMGISAYQIYVSDLDCRRPALIVFGVPDVAARKDHIAMMMDCTSLCKEAACLMSSNSKHVKEICQLCATVCDECSTGCAQFKDDHCQKCAAECKKCADLCRSM